MTFDDSKNSYGAIDLEGGKPSSHIKDAAGVGTSMQLLGHARDSARHQGLEHRI